MRAVDLIPRCVAANDGIKDFADESRIDAEPVVRARGRLLTDDNIIRRCHAVRGDGGRSFRSRFRITHVGDGVRRVRIQCQLCFINGSPQSSCAKAQRWFVNIVLQIEGGVKQTGGLFTILQRLKTHREDIRL